MTLFVAISCVAFPQFAGIISFSLFDPAGGHIDAISYSWHLADDFDIADPTTVKALEGVLIIIQFLGLFAIARGLFMFHERTHRNELIGGQPFVFLIAGAIALNIGTALEIMQASFPLDLSMSSGTSFVASPAGF
jgi:hypothetical protein